MPPEIGGSDHPSFPVGNPTDGYVVGGSTTSGSVNSTAVATDSSGDAYQTGFFSGTVTFGNTTLTAQGASDVFVAKYSSSGALLWVDDIGGSNGTAVATWLAVDNQGNAYVTGYFLGTVNFDPHGNHTLSSVYPGNPNAFVDKLSSSGHYSYAVEIGSGSIALSNAITVDSQGNAYITGFFAGTGNFNPHGSNNLSSSDNGNQFNAFVEKLNSAGNYDWAVDIGYGSTAYGEGIAVDGSGRVYTTGYFSGTGAFNPANSSHDLQTSNNGSDVNTYVSVLNSSGAYVYSDLIGYGGMVQGYGIAVDKSDNVYITGDFSGMGNFNPNGSNTLTSSNNGGNINAFVEKLNASGKFVWAEDLGYGATAYGVSITVDRSGNVYTVGAFSGTGDFNPGSGTSDLTASGNGTQYNAYLSELNSSGQLVSDAIFAYGAIQLDISNVAVSQYGAIFINGDFTGTGVNFDTTGSGKNNLSSPNGSTQYLVELSQPQSDMWPWWMPWFSK